MPAALGVPEWTIVGTWWLAGLYFLTRFPETGPGPDAERRRMAATGR